MSDEGHARDAGTRGDRGTDPDDGYVHDPAAFREGETADAGAAHEPTEREFGWRGWVLVGMIVVAFLVVPGLLLYLPYAGDAVSSLGLSLRDAYIVLPLVPAFLLAVLAVWATTRP